MLLLMVYLYYLKKTTYNSFIDIIIYVKRMPTTDNSISDKDFERQKSRLTKYNFQNIKDTLNLKK